MTPWPHDLFGEILVTQPEIDAWLDAVPRWPLMGWRRDWYCRYWNVPEKIRAAKRAGTFEPIIGAC